MTLNRVLFSSARGDWGTPSELYQELDKEFQFTFDPCPVNPTFDGLAISWADERVYCNPPYGRGVGRWLAKGASLEADLAVFLLPARTDTAWFHDWVLSLAFEIRFIRGRLRFNGAKASAPFPSMLVVYR